MTGAVPPCYDRINHTDCPRRKECARIGRSKCKEWVKYESDHQKDLVEKNKLTRQENADYASRIRFLKRISHHSAK